LIPASSDEAVHFLLLLSDSALPLGSFAFSSGLESYLAHSNNNSGNNSASAAAAGGGSGSTRPSFASFLPLSVSSYAATTLPFVLAAHRRPADDADGLVELDDALDAAIICTVGRRASVAQGRALLGIWERSFAGSLPPDGSGAEARDGGAAALKRYAALLRSSSTSSSSSTAAAATAPSLALPPAVSAHLAPLFGAICRLAGLTAQQTAYVFLLSHVKALVSAAVRAGMFGPYQAQRVLASASTRALIDAAVAREWETPFEEAGQSVPVMDLWIGRHEMLYSRIFNS